MFNEKYIEISSWFSTKISYAIEEFLPKIIWAIFVILLWTLIAYWVYKLVIFLFKKFKIVETIDKLTMKSYFSESEKKENKLKTEKEDSLKKLENFWKISSKIEIDKIVAKSFSYYIFLVFFRLSIVTIGIKEVEDFLAQLINYLPSLFIALVIWFFGIRFANFVYDVVFYSLEIAKNKTSKILASSAKVIVLFFTLMAVLAKVWIAVFITNTILIWFVSMLTIAWWIAFWLGWKEIAKEILESFKK